MGSFPWDKIKVEIDYMQIKKKMLADGNVVVLKSYDTISLVDFTDDDLYDGRPFIETARDAQ
jgi:hypothetical protein